MNKYTIGEIGQRDWGSWEVIDVGENFCLKKLILLPHSQISKQRHQFRSETWVIAAGAAQILINEQWYSALPGMIFRIQEKEIHQLRSLEYGVTVIELQKGEILDESDIERFL